MTQQVCEECGNTFVQKPNTKPKRFCSDACRFRWWGKHPNAGNRIVYSFVCEYCGKEFVS